VRVENDSHFHLAAKPQRLSSAPRNHWFKIEHLDGPREDCERLLDLGFTPGEEVAVTHAAPLGDPIIIHIRGALLALRKREAAWILVK